MAHTTSLAFRSRGLSVTHFRCDGCDAGRAQEECATGHCISLTRAGAWLRRDAQGEHLADPTRVMFFNRGAPYCVTHPVGGVDRCTVLSYSAPLVDEVATSLQMRLDAERSPFDRPWTLATPGLQLSGQQLHAALLDVSRNPIRCEELCLDLLAQALLGKRTERRDRASQATRSRHRRLAREAEIELARRFREPLRLSELARALGSSPFHLARVFREHSGTSIHQRIVALRLAAALEQVAAGEEPVGVIAHEVGFSDHAHLSAGFIRRFGISPSRLRRTLS